MPLTEEQRTAITTAIDGIDEYFARSAEWMTAEPVLRAMIDSSDHIVEPDELIGFDLERARGLRDFLQDDCAEVGDVCAEMIAEIERLRARDRQAAAAIVTMAEGAKQYVLKTHTIMKNVFDEADSLAGYCEELENIVITKDARIKEIEADLEQSERVIEARLDIIDQQAAQIKELKANCIYDPETGKIFVPDGHPELEKLRVRNRDLEDALVEELARGNYFDESQECEGYWWDRKNTSDYTQNDYRERARQQLQVEDKIGPDADAKPHCWQITEERKAAISVALAHSPNWPNDLEKECLAIDVLRAMLEVASQ